MARGKIKNLPIVPRTDTLCIDGHFPDGIVSGTPDITIDPIPPQVLTAGVSYSQDFSVYVSGPDKPGATYALVNVTGTYASQGISFTTSTASAVTPVAGSSVARLVVSKSGTDFLSATFPFTTNAAPATDTVAPAKVMGLSITNVSPTRNDITLDWPADVRTATISPSEPVQIIIERNVNGGAYTQLGSPIIAPGSQPNPALTLASIGTITSPIGSQAAADISLTVTDGIVSSAAESVAWFGGLVSGSFEVAWEATDYASGYAWSSAGCGIRQSLTSRCPSAMATERPNSNAAGAPLLMRAAQDATLTFTADALVAPGTPMKIVRNASNNLVTYRAWNPTSYVWETIGSGTVVMTDPVLVGAFAARSQVGAAITAVVPQFRVNVLNTVTVIDSSVSSGNTYGYRAKARDSAAGANTSLASLPSFISMATTRKWFPGWGILLAGFMEAAADRTAHLAPVFNQATNQGHIMETATMPNVSFIKATVHWGFFESGTTLGNAQYINMNVIQQYLDRCAQAGKMLMLSIFPINYGGAASQLHNGTIVPQYISENPTTYGVTTPLSYGSGGMARTWRPAVNDRLCALQEHILGLFDSHPNFGGTQTEETSINLATGTDGFTPALYMVTLKEQIDRMKAAAHTSQIRTSSNYFNGGDAAAIELAQHILLRKTGCGGPDVTPQETIQWNRVFSGVTGGVDYRGPGPYGAGIGGRNLMPFYSEIQWDSLGSGKEGNFTMEQLWRSALEGKGYQSAVPPPGNEIVITGMRAMNPNMMICYRNVTNLSPWRLMWYADIKPFILSHIGFGSNLQPIGN